MKFIKNNLNANQIEKQNSDGIYDRRKLRYIFLAFFPNDNDSNKLQAYGHVPKVFSSYFKIL